MSATRSAHKKHRRKEQTIFPADFFKETRTSDPRRKWNAPRINASKIWNFGEIERSPNKLNAVSDSTSAFSWENDRDAEVKLPQIKKAHLEETLREFSFPFSLKNSGENSEIDWKQNVRIDRSRDASRNAFYETKEDTPSKRPLPKQLRSETKVSSAVHKKINAGFTSISNNRSSAKDFPVYVPRNLVKCQIDRSSRQRCGYETDGNSRLKGSCARNSKHSVLLDRVQFEQPSEFCILPENESFSSEDSSIADMISEDIFEELCKLADEPTTLPDIFEHEKKALMATFRFQHKGYDEVNGEGKEYSSIDQIVQANRMPVNVSKTVKHKSEKVQMLEHTPFKLSDKLPGECWQKTAYFGN